MHIQLHPFSLRQLCVNTVAPSIASSIMCTYSGTLSRFVNHVYIQWHPFSLRQSCVHTVAPFLASSIMCTYSGTLSLPVTRSTNYNYLHRINGVGAMSNQGCRLKHRPSDGVIWGVWKLRCVCVCVCVCVFVCVYVYETMHRACVSPIDVLIGPVK